MIKQKIFLLIGVTLLGALFAPAQTLPTLPYKPKAPETKPKATAPAKPGPQIRAVEKNQDRDGDGLIDRRDKCPNDYGPPENGGCPQLIVKPRGIMSVTAAMVEVPGGSFAMGSNDGDADEKPVHAVTVSSFKMGKYEVTVKEFSAFVQATGYKTDAETEGDSYVFTGEWKVMKGVSWRDDETGKPRPPEAYNHPVIHISWTDATAYCGWLSRISGKTYRLPTEAEWEYAAGNGGNHTKYSWGNNLPENSKRAGNVADETTHPKFSGRAEKFTGYNDGYFFSAPVGSFAANDLGLYDMCGNVKEWCGDWFGVYTSASQTNPVGPASGEYRVDRGGYWGDKPACSRVAYRIGTRPIARGGNIGFRVVSSL